MSQRARIGVLYPADGDLDEELWRFTPKGVSLHITRTQAPSGSLSVENITTEAESKTLEEHAQLLTTIPLDCIAYLCTAMSFIRGPGYDQEIIQRLEEATGIPATTTSSALIEALNELGVGKLAIIAPYPNEITQRLASFLKGNGVSVVDTNSMNLDCGVAIGRVPTSEVYRMVKESNHEKAQALFISCTGLRTVEVIEALEEDLGKPVLSANQVSIWHSLLISNIKPDLPGLGKLYKK